MSGSGSQGVDDSRELVFKIFVADFKMINTICIVKVSAKMQLNLF